MNLLGGPALTSPKAGLAQSFRVVGQATRRRMVMALVLTNLNLVNPDVSDDPAEARAFLASIVESSNDAIIGKTLCGTILSWNKAAEMLYGYLPSEIVGMPISVLAPPDRPDEVPQFSGGLVREKKIDHLETVRLRKDGALIHVSLTVSPIRNRTGDVIGAATVARDIGSQMRSQELLAKVKPGFGSCSRVILFPCGFTTWRRYGSWKSMKQLLRYGYSRDEFLNMRLTDIRPPERHSHAPQDPGTGAPEHGEKRPFPAPAQRRPHH